MPLRTINFVARIRHVTQPDFSLVVLCYRSGESIIPFVEKLYQALSYCNFTWEVVLVGNYIEGSDDVTPRVVEALARTRPNIRTVVRPKVGMMGWDMRMGLDAGRGEYLGVIDGDGQFPPESVIACLIKAKLQNLDLTKTYRVERDDGLYRRFISATYNLLFKILFRMPIHDVNSKPKIIRRSKYELLQLESNDWFADAEIMIRAGQAGLTIGEIPVHFLANDNRGSFVKPASILEFTSNLFKYRFRRSRQNVREPSL
jgi:glycosyltransferase involved in cell wall biosynthesis